jgi:hypothetical protein
MSRCWTLSKNIALALFAAFLLSACYDGFHRPPGSGGGQGKTGGGGGDKTFGLALVDVFRVSEQAMTDPACGGVPSSLVPLRTAEMEARQKSIIGMIDAQSAQLRVMVTEIPAQDCAMFSSIQNRAATPLMDPFPNGTPDDALKAKLALHVRLVLWYGDRSPVPVSGSISANEWADMLLLQSMGFNRRLSVNHFANAGDNTGYIWSWQQYSDSSHNFLATTVADPLNMDWMKAVQDSAGAFSAWLSQKAAGL